MSATRLVLDIETCACDEASIQSAIEQWRPPGTIKDEKKIAARRAEAGVKIREEAALLDSSPIISIAVKTETQAIVFNGMDLEPYPIEGWTVLPCGDEKMMLWAFSQWAQAVANEHTTLVGHSILRFDLPRLRGRIVWYRLLLPAILDPGQPACDTQRMFKYFSTEHYDEWFISLDTVCTHLGLPRKASLLNGADIPQLYSEGRYAEICTYNCLDCALTEAAYLLMSSTPS
jgi:Predicted 3'-5' exonuclease related to the exonuclease domain of PolB